MKEFALATKVLNSVLTDNLTFKKALKENFSHNGKDNQYIASVSALAGCELRRHLLFAKIGENFPNLDEEEKHLIYLGLANYYFLRRFSTDEVLAYIRDVLKDKFDEKIEYYFTYNGPASETLELDHSSLEYFSIRFNTPAWLLKMWKKHFGTSQSFKILKINGRNAKTFVRFDERKEKPAELKDKEKFVELDGINNIYLYKDKGSIKKLSCYKDDTIYPLNPAIKSLFDKYVDPLLDEYTLYSHSDDSLFKELFVRSNGEKGINLIVPDIGKRVEILRKIRLEKINNVNYFAADNPIAYKTGISHPQDLLILNPISSSFAKIRAYPDYLYHFKQEDIDLILAKQKELLNDLSSFVNDEGLFIYIIDTMNKKEGSGMISSFLKEHSEFSLIEERQILPFEKEDTSLYYAVMKKTKND